MVSCVKIQRRLTVVQLNLLMYGSCEAGLNKHRERNTYSYHDPAKRIAVA